jgi:hypothetical protein
MAAQEVSEMPPMAVKAGPPAKKICKKGKSPLAALMLLLLLSAGMSPIEMCKKPATPLAALAGKMSPIIGAPNETMRR